MARLKNNGAEVFRATRGAKDWRCMSNGAVLEKRPSGGGFRKVGKMAGNLATFQDGADSLRANGWVVEVRSPAWMELGPAPAKRIMRPAPSTAYEARWVDRVDPGLQRARAKQGRA